MRSYPSCWNKVLSKLGFKRKLRKTKNQPTTFQRRSLFENLEQRQLLAVDSFTVDVADDINDGDYSAGNLSLREALVQAATDADLTTIDFAPGISEIQLSGSELLVNSDVEIIGPGADQLTIDAVLGDANEQRVFNISPAVDVTIKDLSITGGKTTSVNHDGAGIFSGGNLRLEDVNVFGNVASRSGGGLFAHNGVVEIINSTFDNNTATYAGAARFQTQSVSVVDIQGSTFSNNDAVSGGALLVIGDNSATTGDVLIVNSTFSGNNATGFAAGAIKVDAHSANPVEIINSTITDNYAKTVGGALGAGGGLVVQNSIVAGNTVSPTGAQNTKDIWNTLLTPSDYNLLGSGLGTQPGANNIVLATGVDPGLAPLGDFGGPTKTHDLLPGSPAIYAGSVSIATSMNLTADQRGEGFPRVINNTVASGASDSRTQVNFTFANNVLTIDDSISGVNQIVLAVMDGQITVNGSEMVDASMVHEIVVIGGNGENRIDLSSLNTSVLPNLIPSAIRVDGGDANDTITGSDFDDELFGNGGDDTINGLGGNDILDGGLGDNTLVGGAGDDTYVILDSADTQVFSSAVISDTSGNDTLDLSQIVNPSGATINLSQPAGAIYGFPTFTTALRFLEFEAIENAIGTDFDDNITGNTLGNRLEGGDGSDTLIGLGGNDTYVFSDDPTPNSTDQVTVNDSAGDDTFDFTTVYSLVDVDTIGGTFSYPGVSGTILPQGDSIENIVGNNGLVAPRRVEARAVGPTSIEVTWEASEGAIDYLVARRQPDTETQFTIIDPNVVGTSYTDSSGLLPDTLYEYLLVAQRNPSSVPSQVAQATTNRSNLTAYRPQGVYDHDDDSTPDPIYDPFPKRPVREQDEFSNAIGPGIRINGDDDNRNNVQDFAESGNAITRENDLIEVKIDRLPGGGNQVLQAVSPLRLYYDHDKDTPIPMFGNQTELLPFNDDTLTVFVEWQSSTHGTQILSLLDATTFASLDSIRFHSFTSFTVVFGGRKQNPRDTDGDGSIGDVIKGANREGIFDLAQVLYDTGYDVMAVDEADYTLFAESAAEREIRNAIDNRFVRRNFSTNLTGGLSLMGYSQGGGVVQNMIEDELDPINNPQYLPTFGVYLDAVRHDSPFAETDWPDSVFHLLNIYETRIELPISLGGGDIDNNDVLPGAILEEVNVTAAPNFNNNLDHFDIDDDFDVKSLIFLRQQQLLSR